MKAPESIASTTLPAEVVRFARHVVACLARGLTLEENHRGFKARIDGLRTDAMPADVRTDMTTVPEEVRVLAMTQRDGDGARTSGNKPTWQWVPGASGGGTVRITAIEGMTAGVAYDVVAWIGGG